MFFDKGHRQYIREIGPLRWASRYAVRQFNKRVLRRGVNLKLPTGVTIYLPRDSRNSTSVYVTNANIDWGCEVLFARFAEKTRDFFDVGAHIGYYSAYLSPLVRRVYAFEPHPGNRDALARNAERAGNVEVIAKAVSSQTGEGVFNIGPDNSTSGINRQGRPIRVPLTAIDDFVAERGNADPALIKIDTEGHDVEVLKGMRRTVAKSQPLILTECDDRDSMMRLCSEWGYSAFAFVRDRSSYEAQFQRFDSSDDFRDRWVNMTFLVPRRLAPAFAERADALNLAPPIRTRNTALCRNG